MATINPVAVDTRVPGTTTVKWETLTEADTAASHAPGGYEPAIANIQVVGSFGGATITLKGSNDDTNWVTIKDVNGSAIELNSTNTSADFSSAMLYFKPEAANGSSQDVDVLINFRG